MERECRRRSTRSTRTDRPMVSPPSSRRTEGWSLSCLIQVRPYLPLPVFAAAAFLSLPSVLLSLFLPPLPVLLERVVALDANSWVDPELKGHNGGMGPWFRMFQNLRGASALYLLLCFSALFRHLLLRTTRLTVCLFNASCRLVLVAAGGRKAGVVVVRFWIWVFFFLSSLLAIYISESTYRDLIICLLDSRKGQPHGTLASPPPFNPRRRPTLLFIFLLSFSSLPFPSVSATR
jgi:hypothetical protein